MQILTNKDAENPLSLRRILSVISIECRNASENLRSTKGYGERSNFIFFLMMEPTGGR